MPLYGSDGGYLLYPEIALATRRGRAVENRQLEERPLEAMRAARDIVLSHHPTARARSLRSGYNCMGMVFASRRTAIDPDQLGVILSDDGYVRISESEIEAGDLVVYRGDNKEVSHVGIVFQVGLYRENNVRDVFALSQWGLDGEYFHEMRDVNPQLGTPAEFWTDRYGLA